MLKEKLIMHIHIKQRLLITNIINNKNVIFEKICLSG